MARATSPGQDCPKKHDHII